MGLTPSNHGRGWISKLSGNTLYFEKKLELAGVKFDLSGHGWATKPEK